MITLAMDAALLLAFAKGSSDNFKGVATLYGSKQLRTEQRYSGAR